MRRLRGLGRAGTGFRAVAAPADPAALAGDGAALTEASAEVVEGDGRLRARVVGAAEPGPFSCFLDGIQRAGVLLYHGPVPVVYAWTGAVVRVRAGRRMATLRSAAGAAYHRERERVLFPYAHLAPAALASVGLDAASVQDTAPDETPPLFPPLLYARASDAVNRGREALERELAERWCADAATSPGWLLVDGSLTGSAELAACERAVGLVKGHRTRFFDGDEARLVLGLRHGERTSAFRPSTRSFTPVLSWYLRLRPTAGRDVLWGLVRVEASPGPVEPRRIDAISRWLLAETAPLALPDPRWDRMIYPIRDCEAFLRSRAPRL